MKVLHVWESPGDPGKAQVLIQYRFWALVSILTSSQVMLVVPGPQLNSEGPEHGLAEWQEVPFMAPLSVC